ncbi:MAG TPA: hypothetical protein VNK04_02925 [Gemmataceae bacterium]|jgi:hypothetical protein|nr:hypothetical protein [Gemmataceae bacterium]
MTRKLAWFAAAGLLLALGCSKGGPERYDVRGTVTFKGSLVPAGQVIFDPDQSKGNDGAQGYAEIHDGRYDTRKSAKGAPPGPVIVRIEGFDGQATVDRPYGNPLFVDYRVRMEIPRENIQKDFDVPASAAESVRKLSPTSP